MFVLISKLKLLKAKLKYWHRTNHSFLQSRIQSGEKKLPALTSATQNANAKHETFIAEKEMIVKLPNLKNAYYSDLQQRSKIDYISWNVENCHYFYAKLKENKSTRKNILSLMLKALCMTRNSPLLQPL